MTDDVCDSWEDVDVDKIVIKPSTKTNPSHRPTYSSILASNCARNSSKIIVDNFDSSPTSAVQPNGTSSFRILQRVSDSSPSSDQLPFANQPKIVLEDNTRTQFVKGLRILNRPKEEKNNQDTSKNKDEIQQQLKKSFEEKRAEYAKARLRILGEKTPADDDISNVIESMNAIQVDNENPTVSDQTSKTNVVRIGSGDNRVQTASQQQLPQPIIRQPIAPDGTRGFRSRN